ncbi:MAG: LamG domain-containing protein [Planctomycetes bacterium]|nr:LamG domain-containing protein [Planctomycetota bacterium]
MQLRVALSLLVVTTGLHAQSGGNLAFDGIADRATGPGGGLFDFSGNYTLEAWINPTTTVGQDSICGRGDGFSGLSGEYAFQLFDGRPRLRHAGGAWFEANSIVPAGEWNHVAVVVTSTTYRFYLNGHPDGNGTHSQTLAASAMPFTLGKQGSVFTDNFWHGRLDDVRVWSVARTESEIRSGVHGCGLGSPGLVARYEFDCVIGQTLLDTSGNGLDAVLGTTATSELVDPTPTPPHPLGEALEFDGIDDRATGPGGSAFDLPFNFTIEAWVHPTAITGERTICARGTGFGGSHEFVFQLLNGKPRLFHANESSWFQANTTLPADQWNHVAIVVTPTTFRFYLNGQSDGVGSHFGALGSGAETFVIGKQGTGADRFWQGMLDDVRVWGSARSASQILDNMWALANPLGEASLIACYDMDGRSQTVFDRSANANHAALGSSVSVESTDPERTGDSFFDPHIGTAQGAGDDTIESLALGFPFAFPDGTTTSTVDVDSNGVIYIPPAAWSDHVPLVSTLRNNPSALYPFWYDMTLLGVADDVYFQALPDVALITWECARFYLGSDLFRIQAQLYPDGSFRFVYPSGIPSSIPVIGASEGGGVSGPGPTDLSAIPEGAPLTGGGSTIYEHVAFDLVNPFGPDAMLLFSPNGSGYDVSSNMPVRAAATKHGQACRRSIRFVQGGSGVYTVSDVADAFDPDFGAVIVASGDDLIAGPFNLGFMFTFPGGSDSSTVDLDTNGRILPPSSDSTDSVPDVASFLAESHPTIAPFWSDLIVGGGVGGAIYQKSGPGFSRFTWGDVAQYAGSQPITFQATLFDDDSITVTLVGTALFDESIGYYDGNSEALIGVSDGFLFSTPAEQDFSALPVASPGAVYEFWDGAFEDLDLQLTLESLNVPVLGSTWEMRLDGLPGSSFAVAVIMGVSNPDLDLTGTGIGLDGCYLLTTGNLGSLPAGISGSQSTVVTVNFELGQTGLVGFTMFMQGAVLAPGTTPLGAALSNGVRATVGY